MSARHFFQQRTYSLRGDDVLNHIWIPNQRIDTPHFADRGVPPYTRYVNSQGWLSTYDFAKDKPEGTYRIAYVGDSFVEGTCAEEDSLPALVQRGLAGAGKRPVEVMNTGTSSYSPTLYYILLSKKLLDFHPDLVVINVDMTDVFDDTIYRATVKLDERGNPDVCPTGHPAISTHRRTEKGLEPITPAQRVLIFSQKHSALIRMLLDVASQLKRQRKLSDRDVAPQAFAWCGTERTPQTQEDVNWSMNILRRTIQLVKAKGSKVVVTAVPHLQQLQGKWSFQPMKDIAEVCAQENVPFLDPVKEFQSRLGSTSPETLYIPDNMHFNPKGYRMWAEIQVEFLNQVGLP